MQLLTAMDIEDKKSNKLWHNFKISVAYTEWANKKMALYFCPYLRQLLTDFQNYFTGTL